MSFECGGPGVAFGLSTLFVDDFLLKLCGKCCGLTYAFIAIFGKDAARFFEAAVWLAGALFFGFLANKKK
jgi:hypothetical protein